MPFVGELRPFQAAAVEQLLDWGGSGLLSIIMGGGKTVATIALLEQLFDDEEVEAGLIVVPPGIKRQWVNALHQFAPESNVMMIHGTPKQREQQYADAVDWAEYVILGYPQLLSDWEYLQGMLTDFIVADEVQAIKNFRAKRSKKLKALGGMIRIGLTGQPLENRPEDVYSIMEWIDPDLLGRFDIFDRTFIVRNNWGRPVRYKNLPTLRNRLESNAMVRYSRQDIADQLPEKTEETWVIDFDSASAKLYRVISRDLIEAIDAAGELGTKKFDLNAHYGRGNDESAAELAMRGRIMSRLTCMRMLCDHPDLIRESARQYQESQKLDLSGSVKTGSAYAHELQQRGLLDKKYGTPKFKDTIELIKEILSEDPANKVALFSFFKPTLYWLHAELAEETGAVLYTGDTSGQGKQDAVDAFNNDRRTRLFLSSDAGGSGVDLPAGNYHINYDLPFSAGQLEQRNARLDRIASAHARLLVTNHLMAESIEEFYYEVLLNRQRLSAAVIDGARLPKGSLTLNTKTLRDYVAEKLSSSTA